MTRTESLALRKSPVNISNSYHYHCLLRLTLGTSLALSGPENSLVKWGEMRQPKSAWHPQELTGCSREPSEPSASAARPPSATVRRRHHVGSSGAMSVSVSGGVRKVAVPAAREPEHICYVCLE